MVHINGKYSDNNDIISSLHLSDDSMSMMLSPTPVPYDTKVLPCYDFFKRKSTGSLLSELPI